MKLLSAVLLFLLLSRNTLTIDVRPSCPTPSPPDQCFDINRALSTLANDTELQFLEGTHTIRHSISIGNISNISLVGGANVTVTCSEYEGLFFYGIGNLTITSIAFIECGMIGHEEICTSMFAVQMNCRLPSLLITDCHNVIMKNVSISGSKGVGLVSLDVTGSFVLSDVEFKGNIGGGAYLVYLDHKHSPRPSTTPVVYVNITRCTFFKNTNHFDQFLDLDIKPLASAGGGLTVALTQSSFTVETHIESSVFERNTASYGSGVHISMLSSVLDNLLQFSDCTFRSNYNSNMGGGLFIILSGTTPFTRSSLSRNIKIMGSSFINNTALDGSGLYIQLLPFALNTVIILQSTTFEENVATEASTIAAYGISESVNSLLVILSDCTIKNNYCTDYLAETATAMRVTNGRLKLERDCTFSSNKGTALTCSVCEINISGKAVFANNTGINGGALHLSDGGYLRLYDNSHLFFLDNVATTFGGAIYADINDRKANGGDCFIRVDNNYHFDDCIFDDGQLHTVVDFRGNKAPIASMIYGAYLRDCLWNGDSNRAANYTNFYQYLYSECVNKTFINFDDEPVGIDRVSSPSIRLIVVNADMVNVMPGQRFEIFVTSFDVFNQSIPDLLTYSLPEEEGAVFSNIQSLSRSNRLLPLDEKKGLIPLTLFGTQNKSINLKISSITSPSAASVTISVQLKTCLLGYSFDSSIMSCQCDQRLANLRIQCFLNGTFIIPPGIWLGRNESETGLIWGYCPKPYCNDHYKIITNLDFTRQCSHNHAGLLCSGCRDNLTVSLGSSKVCKRCSNSSLWIIAALLIVGILFIVALVLFDINITAGYFNSILFYSNIISIYKYFFIPDVEWNIIFIVADFLSFDLNIYQCLYQGMTEFVGIIVQFIFIAYIFLLLGAIYVVAIRCSLPESCSPAKVGATVIIVCYISILRTCVRSLAFVRLYTLDGFIADYRWKEDPNLIYFKSAHGFLVIVSILIILVFMVPFTFIITCPKFAFKITYLATKLKPVYDVIWAPFKPERCWWLGLRLILRLVIYSCAVTLTNVNGLFALGLILLGLLFLQTKLMPYTKQWMNILDDFLLVLVLLFILGTLYFTNLQSTQFYYPIYDPSPVYYRDSPTPPSLVASNITILMLFYAVVLGVIVVHFRKRFPNFFADIKKCWRHVLENCDTGRPELVKEEAEPIVTSTDVSIAGLKEDCNLNETPVITTTGHVATNVTVMHHHEEPSSMQLEARQDASESSFSPLTESDERQTDTYYTCKNE